MLVTIIVGSPALEASDAQAYARRWFLLSPQGQCLTDPALGSVALSMKHGNLIIRAPGMLRLDIPLEVLEDDPSVQSQVQFQGQTVTVVDEGDLAAVWFSNLLAKPCRLVKVHPDNEVPPWLGKN